MRTWVIKELGATRVEIRCDERNIPSAAIARRLGYVQEGRLRNDTRASDGSLRNTLIFSLTAEDSAKPGPNRRQCKGYR